jgi:hypothetical protein
MSKESLKQKIAKHVKVVRIYQQHNGHYWIEEEDLAKIAPNLESDSSLLIPLINHDDIVAILNEVTKQIQELNSIVECPSIAIYEADRLWYGQLQKKMKEFLAVLDGEKKS